MGMILDSCVCIELASNQVNRQAVIKVAGNFNRVVYDISGKPPATTEWKKKLFRSLR
jgi:GMP synthase PP-ATPase subunit